MTEGSVCRGMCLRKPVEKHARHQRTLRVHGRFALHQRCNRNHLVHVLLQSQLRGRHAEPLHHGRHDLHRGHRGRKPVRVRKQIAFEARRSRIEIGNQPRLAGRGGHKILARAQAGLLHARGDIKNIRALRHGQRYGYHVAARNPRINLSHRSGMVEQVNPRLQFSAPKPAHQIERVPAAHHARRLQHAPNGHNGRARRHIHEGLRLRPVRSKHQPCHGPRREQGQQKQPQQEATNAGTLFSSAFPPAPCHPADVDPSS